jgi:hypothetical protein
MTQTNEAAFETVIEAHLLANGYVTMNRDGFDRERAISSETVGLVRRNSVYRMPWTAVYCGF